MNPFDAERSRIAAEHDAGDMTDKDYRRLSRAIDRAQKFDNEIELRNQRALVAQQKFYRKRKQAQERLREQLTASMEVWS